MPFINGVGKSSSIGKSSCFFNGSIGSILVNFGRAFMHCTSTTKSIRPHFSTHSILPLVI